MNLIEVEKKEKKIEIDKSIKFPKEILRYDRTFFDKNFRVIPNIGNSCYLASILQCLIRTNFSQLNGIGFITIILETMLKTSNNHFDLRFLHDALAEKNEKWNNFRPQDAMELLMSLIEMIQQETKDFLEDPDLTQEELEKGNQNMSICNMFQGEFFITITCDDCGEQINFRNEFQCLGIALIKQKNISSNQLLEIYFTPSLMIGENAWICSKCDEQNASFHSFKISKIPEILVIYFKRLEYDPIKKLNFKNSLAIIPNEFLDLSSFLQDPLENPTYSLFGIIFHQQKEDFAHFFSFCKREMDRTWWEFNDGYQPILQDPFKFSEDIQFLFYHRNY